MIVLSREYLHTSWAMEELREVLDRLQGPAPVMLLPVLLDGLTMEDFLHAKDRVYGASWP